MVDETGIPGLSVLNRRQDRLLRVATLLAVGVAVLCAALAVTLVVLFRVSGDVVESVDILRECTTPSPEGERHECYERGQAGQAEAVGSINVVTILAEQCAADGLPIKPCVEDRLHAALAEVEGD